MGARILFVISILLTAISLGGGLAHLYALPTKMQFGREEYLVAQQVYAGWALLGIPIFLALLSTIVLAVIERHDPSFYFVVGAAVCIALSLAVFFTFTFPANRATANWTFLPENWEQLRQRWEYSHAVGALLYLAALAMLAIGAVRQR